MLDINMEFRKGILFIRLNGALIKDTVPTLEKEVTSLIKENGIRNVVFNMENLLSIDMNGISSLYSNFELCRNNHGTSILCSLENQFVSLKIRNSRLSRYMSEASDELTAIHMINV